MAQDTSIQQKSGTEAVRPEETRSGWHYRPHVDIIESDNDLTILIDMPGADRSGIDVRFENGMLTIQGRVTERQQERTEYLLHEYGVGDFYRTFQIGEAIDSSCIGADYGDGVLTVHLPKSDAARARRIEVKQK